jgi:hypothetical protein
MEAIVYRGADNHPPQASNQPIFFSSSPMFAKDYGVVASYKITLTRPFDTCKEEDIEFLLSVIGELTDHYSGEVFHSYEELENSGLLSHDTWEIFEPHMERIRRLGYDGMIIYEGGTENYVTFYHDNFQLI